MSAPGSVSSLAHVSVAAPSELMAAGVKRLELFLHPGKDGRLRWHHGDGKPTVVDGTSVDHALRVARMVWRDLQVVAVQSAAATNS